jgi:hypothetical protein
MMVAFLIATVALTSSAQQVELLSKKAATVKRKADSLTPSDPISVVRIHAEEEYGNFLSSDQEGFTFYDVDRQVNVTLKYADVKKIKNGYGGYNALRQRHTDRTKALIAGAVVVGLLGTIIGVAACARN